MNEPRHCDSYINDPQAPKALRDFLKVNRCPAVYRSKGIELLGGKEPVLYANIKEAIKHMDADYKAGQRVRVVMASRFGDVGITPDLTAARGYDLRVDIEKLENFGDQP